MDNLLMALIDFDSFKEAFYFISGVTTGLVGSFVSYSRWLRERTRKQYAAEHDFALLRQQYELLRNQQTETGNILRNLEGDLREFRGMLSSCISSGGSRNDNREEG